MIKKTSTPETVLTFMQVQSFDVDLHLVEQDDVDEYLYHPVITLEVYTNVDESPTEQVLKTIVLDTKIFCEDPEEAVYHAALTGFYLTEKYKSEVFVFHDFEKVSNESYTIEDAMNAFDTDAPIELTGSIH